ncbi:hypothetical protein FEM03_11860 [Phragmitibacter flavus]|uniref:Uncharacterized protein n=1 Tax=Phragmitibacter flavus TaxID=2576071 RepID=A0A5R8KDP7_9BACT|nr:hypothetical protein [Phragmitibacter flavus]TLD70421.1 hypothetical protein FEM03_11860 [Phragmitibacter flavus]
MQTTGIVLAVLGGLLVGISTLAMSCRATDKASSAAEMFDIFILGGLVSGIRNFFTSVSDGMKNRSSREFPLVVILGIGTVLLTTGFLLM